MDEQRWIIIARDGIEERFEPESFPLSIGGRETDEIRVRIDAGAVAVVGFLDGDAFIQSSKSSQDTSLAPC